MTMKQPISHTPEGAVSVSYTTLLSAPGSLNEAIERAFGSNPECLGIIIVRDLPPTYAAYRQRLLTLAYKFAKLDENVREQYTDASSSYSFGWSHGKVCYHYGAHLYRQPMHPSRKS
ncbi:hypothetical protein EDD18DRAFT_1121760 [Armillaria luteobubalina]|uniref:Uncharacterized protein n=1 Tax=Armillaria luteobubalina TaxID=153913 RepID=A0AA39QN58_9AGAR|nr:hypothetical protein EDD18DRAFT_1121760 [Armillaria luteobubalina]